MMRDMRPEDIDRVFSIEQSVQAYPWSRGNFSDAVRLGYTCRVEEEDHEVRGYAVLRPILDDAELLNIGVAKEHQHKGLGRAILRDMLDIARQRSFHRIFLEVRPSNAPALALYLAASFREVGTRRDYYHHGERKEDAITMACELTGDARG
jgi:ribosomal-protein-alanine N-acetyltransferase